MVIKVIYIGVENENLFLTQKHKKLTIFKLVIY